MCVYVCICMHGVHVRMYAMHACTYVCMYVCACASLTCVMIHTCMRMYVWMYVCARVVLLCKYVHMCLSVCVVLEDISGQNGDWDDAQNRELGLHLPLPPILPRALVINCSCASRALSEIPCCHVSTSAFQEGISSCPDPCFLESYFCAFTWCANRKQRFPFYLGGFTNTILFFSFLPFLLSFLWVRRGMPYRPSGICQDTSAEAVLFHPFMKVWLGLACLYVLSTFMFWFWVSRSRLDIVLQWDFNCFYLVASKPDDGFEVHYLWYRWMNGPFAWNCCFTLLN